MLARLDELERERTDFAFESTLASRTFAPRIERLRDDGYRVHVVFLWLPSAEMAVARVRARVRAGGHGVPAATVRRRYVRGLRNFFDLYAPLGDEWQLFDNSMSDPYILVAEGGRRRSTEIRDEAIYSAVLETLDAARRAEA